MVNKVILLGNLAMDPEVKATPKGTYVANIRLATHTYIGKDDGGKAKEETEFHRLVAFGKLAEPRADCPYAKARRAVTFLGRLIPDDPTGANYYNKYDHEADKIKTPRPKDIAESIEWLTAGVLQAGRDLTDSSLSTLTASYSISFQYLHSVLTSTTAS